MIIDWTSGATDQQATAMPFGVWNWSGVAGAAASADPYGLEFTLPDNRFHYTAPDIRMHFTTPENRLQFTLPTED
jgi:hypothetical protein